MISGVCHGEDDYGVRVVCRTPWNKLWDQKHGSITGWDREKKNYLVRLDGNQFSDMLFDASELEAE
jgi:hypothetical protein